MKRIKLIKDSKYGKRDDIITVSNNEAFGIIDSGIGIITKDIISTDIKTKSLDEEQANGNTTKLRPNFKSRR